MREGEIEVMIKLKVDLEMIANAMDDVARVDMDYYLDKETGEVIFLLEETSRYAEEEKDENLREGLPDWQKKKGLVKGKAKP